ncbi:hypothetical protein LENED_008807 [Lentinula edodes]|uniref:Uncharacterized protein n=1 Tax=Lentinula edodes TaxID=5353 RepID=A0A1Q3EI42_LENED|nr:hypothetical protein LENED_008807 [Lentinula edodes]
MDGTPASNEPPTTNDSDAPAPATHLRQRLRLIRRTVEDTDTVNECATSSTSSLNRRRKLSSCDLEDAQSSSSQNENISERPNKVTDFKVQVVKRVVEREVLPVIVRQQLVENEERIQFLQQELEKGPNAVQDPTLQHPRPKEKEDSRDVERRKLREDILDKGRIIATLTALTTNLQENAAEIRRDADGLCKELKNTKQSSDTLDEELKKSKRDADALREESKNTIQNSHITNEELKNSKVEVANVTRSVEAVNEEIKRLNEKLGQKATAKESEIENLMAKLVKAQNELKENKLRTDVVLNKCRNESKTQILRYEKQIKDLDTSIVTKDSQMQTLNSKIQALETKRAQLEANVMAAKNKLGDKSKARTVQVEQFEQRIKEFEESITLKDSHILTLGNTIQSLEMEKRQLQESVAVEKTQILRYEKQVKDLDTSIVTKERKANTQLQNSSVRTKRALS